jgi:hypothetical protein
MTGADLLAELRLPGAHPQKQRLAAIVDEVWPDAGERGMWYVQGLLGAVDDVRQGAPAPWPAKGRR